MKSSETGIWEIFGRADMPRDFKKSEKTSGKEKWRNPFSVLPPKARGREIAGKIQNISEITNHINHKTRVYVINRRVSTSLF